MTRSAPTRPAAGLRTAGRILASRLGSLVLGIAWAAIPAIVAAASPTPSRPASSDTRSALEGPGFVGSPLLAIVVVAVIAIGAILATVLYVRLTAGSHPPPDD